MIWHLQQGQDVTPKYLVNGCPKHGLHLLAMMVEGAVNPAPDSLFTDRNWVGTFMDHSFSLQWNNMDRWFFIMSRLQQGQYYRGHVGYRQDVSEFMRLARVGHVFIYRDLRDVAVSQAYHVLNRTPNRFNHPQDKSTHHRAGDVPDTAKYRRSKSFQAWYEANIVINDPILNSPHHTRCSTQCTA